MISDLLAGPEVAFNQCEMVSEICYHQVREREEE